jgi:hypothetical protein
MNAASNIPVVAMLPLDWVRSASAWSCRSSSRSRPNVGGARSPLTPLDAARTTANREGAASGRRLHPTRATRGATVSGSATAKAISLTSRPAPAHQRSPPPPSLSSSVGRGRGGRSLAPVGPLGCAGCNCS